jgi:hypothetical protein
MRTFEVQKLKIINNLDKALSQIHITADLWTSSNNKSILGVIAHYISEKGTLAHHVLGVQEVQGEHTGENQASVVQNILTDFGIIKKVGYFVGDNASTNDTLCESLSKCTIHLSLCYKHC